MTQLSRTTIFTDNHLLTSFPILTYAWYNIMSYIYVRWPSFGIQQFLEFSTPNSWALFLWLDDFSGFTSSSGFKFWDCTQQYFEFMLLRSWPVMPSKPILEILEVPRSRAQLCRVGIIWMCLVLQAKVYSCIWGSDNICLSLWLICFPFTYYFLLYFLFWTSDCTGVSNFIGFCQGIFSTHVPAYLTIWRYN